MMKLRKTIEDDLEIFFINQLDDDANFMAAFTPKDPSDREGYLTKWKKLLKDESINMRTILVGNDIAGTVLKFEIKGEAEITYALGKKFWGKGIATQALQEFLLTEPKRPIFGKSAFDNYASARVMEKCGFKQIGTDQGFANARGKEIEGRIFRLD
jgi:[ribosomal protein S5]-alanine N-acetyltransferase